MMGHYYQVACVHQIPASVFRTPEEEYSEKELPRDKTLSNSELPVCPQRHDASICRLQASRYSNY